MFKKILLPLVLFLLIINCGGGGGGGDDSGGGDDGGGTGPVNDPPVASFIGAPLSGNAPLTVSFSSTSSNTSTNTWDFNNDGTNDATGSQVSYTYNEVGSFSVKLESSGAGGTDTLIRENYINVNSSPPTVSFSGEPTSGTKDLRVQFTNSSQNYNTLIWDFGDGNSSTDTNPVHIYTTAGSYDVSLSATGNGGTETSSSTGYITVSEIQTPAFIIDSKYTSGTSGSSVSVDWNILGATDVAAAQAKIVYDPAAVTIGNVTTGDFLEGNNVPLLVTTPSDPSTANGELIIYTSSLSSDKPSADGDGTLATISFTVNASAGELVAISFGTTGDQQTLDVDGNDITLNQTVNGYIIVE